VVNVEIDNGDFLELIFLLEIFGGDGDVGEEAEAHGVIGLGVMAGGTDGGEGALDGGVHDGVAGLEDGAQGEEGDVEAGRGDGGIAFIEDAAAAGAHFLDAVDVGLGMDGAEPFGVGRVRLDGVEEILEGRQGAEILGELCEGIAGDELGLVEGGVDGADAVGPLGMAGAGVVFDKAGAGGKTDHQRISLPQKGAILTLSRALALSLILNLSLHPSASHVCDEMPEEEKEEDED